MKPLHLTFALGFLGFVSLSAARVVLSLYALELGAQPFAVGVLVAMFYVFPLLLSWPLGALSDRIGSRWPLVFGAASGAVGLVIPYFWGVLPALFVAAALSGLSLAITHVNLQNLVGLISLPADRTRNFSNFSMVGAATNFVGPLIAGLAIDNAGFAIACLYVMALSVLGVIFAAGWGQILPISPRSSAPPVRILDTLTDRDIVRTLATSSLAQLGTDLYQFYLPIYGHAAGLSATVIGVVLASFALASFTVRVVMARLVQKFGDERLLAYSFYLGAVAFLLVPFFNGVITLTLISFMFGLGMGCAQPITMILMFRHSPKGRSGATLGMRLTANNLMRVLGPAVFGSVGSALGLFAVFWINGLVMGAGGFLARPTNAARRVP